MYVYMVVHYLRRSAYWGFHIIKSVSTYLCGYIAKDMSTDLAILMNNINALTYGCTSTLLGELTLLIFTNNFLLHTYIARIGFHLP